MVFPDDAEGAAWRLRQVTDPLPNETGDGVSTLWARSHVYGEIAKQNTMESSPYVSTALVARDMLSIMRIHGFDKLQYWGFSCALSFRGDVYKSNLRTVTVPP